MHEQPSVACFLLTHGSRNTQNGFEIRLWGVTSAGVPVQIIIDTFRPLFFVPRSVPADLTKPAHTRTQTALKTMHGAPVDCLYFTGSIPCRKLAAFLREKAIRTGEADIHPVERYLMERMVMGGFSVEGEPLSRQGIAVYKNPRIRGCAAVGVSLSVLSVDIEIDVDSGRIYSIACSGKKDAVFMTGDQQNRSTITFCRDEKELLRLFLGWIKNEDPDILIGWNVVHFDLTVLKKRCDIHGIPFEIGREPGTFFTLPREESKQPSIRVPGRVVLDVPVMLRAYNYSFERFTLDAVAHALLGKRKLIAGEGIKKIEEINRLFKEDKEHLAEYNLHDARLAKEIFDASNLLPNAIERSKLCGHLLDRFGGSVAAFDYLYLPRLHRLGYVAGNSADSSAVEDAIPGGHVLEPKPGIYKNVLLLDFKSLYPTIILSFMIDPLGAVVDSENRITGPAGIGFSRDPSILPGIISTLMAERAKARETGNRPLSNAIKILMNSFYGVLGAQGCRFFSRDLAVAITRTGQYILKSTIAYIEQHTPYAVIYGDTDSLFVLLGPDGAAGAEKTGAAIAAEVNRWLRGHLKEKFNADSFLELQFESYFRHFFMPAIRGSDRGSKKRYCGTIEKEGRLILSFKGLESARSDWTPLAKEFQQILYEKVFKEEPVQQYVIATVNRVKNGQADDLLVYQKQLRKPLHEYTANIPPHAQAAKLLDTPGSVIRYYITTQGPQPVEKRSAPLDYEHYIEAQLRPIADSILEWIGLDFDGIVSGQQSLF